jgi:DNA processing protein
LSSAEKWAKLKEYFMKYLNALNVISGTGPQKMKMLMEFFGSAESAWKADIKNLEQSGIGEALSKKMVLERERINPDEEWEKLEKENIKIVSFTDANYPKLLKEIPSAPYILYVKSASGEIFDFNNQPMLAIVGSRKYTAYGKQVAEKISYDLTRAGLAIVSGMALGIDSFAHRGVLEAGGKTIAVLGSSLEDKNIGPRSNFELSRRIMESGVLVSDFPCGVSSIPGNFPARNRLMAGLALGTLVIEAARESGSLITANLALEFNREVFSVPGSIFSPQSEGTNDLIKSGAKLAASAKDILEELKIEERAETEKVKKIIPASPEEEKILKILSPDPLHIDNITKLSKLETNVVSSTLSLMEMKGMVKNIGGQNYIIL